MSEEIKIADLPEPELVAPVDGFRVLKFSSQHQIIERLQQRHYSTVRGFFWEDVPVIHIETPYENPK